jgi:hypothetical protein
MSPPAFTLPREDRAHDPPTCAARVRDSSCYVRCCMPTRWDSGAVAAASIAGSENADSPLAWPVAPTEASYSPPTKIVSCRPCSLQAPRETGVDG